MKIYYKKNSGVDGFISVVMVEFHVSFGNNGLLISNEEFENKDFNKNEFVQEECADLLKSMTDNKVIDSASWIQDPFELFQEKNKK